MARPVIRGDHEQGVLLEARLAEMVPNPTDTGIGVHDEVPVHSDGALPLESGFGRTGCVGRCQGDEEKEGLFLLRFGGNEFPRFIAEGGQDFGIQKILGCGAHPIEGTPALLSGYLALPFLPSDVGIGEHIEGTGQEKAMVESVIRGPNFNRLGKICVLGTLYLSVLGGHSRAQVPFTDVTRRVSARPKHLAHGMLRGRKAQADESPRSALFAFAEPEGVAPGHDGGPAGHADRVGDVSVGELHAILAETVEVRGGDFGLFASEGLYVSIAQVVGEDEDDVWSFGSRQKEARRKNDN